MNKRREKGEKGRRAGGPPFPLTLPPLPLSPPCPKLLCCTPVAHPRLSSLEIPRETREGKKGEKGRCRGRGPRGKRGGRGKKTRTKGAKVTQKGPKGGDRGETKQFCP